MSFFKKFTDTVSKGVSTATEKAQQTVEITRLHSQISGKKKDVEKKYAEIGEAVFAAYLEQDLSRAEGELIPACESITAIRIEIAALEDRIRALRNEKECECGTKVSFDTRFCPSCGQPFTDPVPVKAEPVAATEGIEALPVEAANAIPEEPTADEPTDLTVTASEHSLAHDHADALGTEAEYGYPIVEEEAVRTCSACHLEMPDEARFCQNCGNPMYP